MFTKSAPIFGALASFWFLTFGAHADSTQLAQRSIRAAYRAGDAAMSAKDVGKAFSFLAPDYQLINVKGHKLDRAAVVQSMKRWFAVSRSYKVRTTVKKLSVAPNKATVVVAERDEIVLFNYKTRKPAKVVADSTGEEIWVRLDGKWLKQKTKTLTMKLLVDGKPRKP